MNSATFYRGTGSSSKLFRKIPKIPNFSKHCILEHGIEKSRREKNFIISLPSTRLFSLPPSTFPEAQGEGEAEEIARVALAEFAENECEVELEEED